MGHLKEKMCPLIDLGLSVFFRSYASNSLHVKMTICNYFIYSAP